MMLSSYASTLHYDDILLASPPSLPHTPSFPLRPVTMAPAHQAPWLLLLERLAAHLKAHASDTSGEKDRKAKSTEFVKILEDVCAVVRDAERKAAPEFAEVVEKAHGILNDALRYAYSQAGGFSSVATFAHSEDEPFVEDALEHAGAYL